MDQAQSATLWRMVRDIGVGMLVTGDGKDLRGRPMVAVQESFDGTLWFFTHDSSPKVGEVESDQHVCVTYAAPAKQEFVSFTGRAETVRDRQTIQAHWSEDCRPWFPKGPDDADIALLRVTVDHAQYWDHDQKRMVD